MERKKALAVALVASFIVLSFSVTSVSASRFIIQDGYTYVNPSPYLVPSHSWAQVSASGYGGRVPYTRYYDFFGWVTSNYWFLKGLLLSSEINNAYITVSGQGFNTLTVWLVRNNWVNPDNSPYITAEVNSGVLTVYWSFHTIVNKYVEPWGQAVLHVESTQIIWQVTYDNIAQCYGYYEGEL